MFKSFKKRREAKAKAHAEAAIAVFGNSVDLSVFDHLKEKHEEQKRNPNTKYRKRES